jgi:DNA-binding transcriptional MerR regulator
MMEKPVSQIMFDFSAPTMEEDAIVAPTPVTVKENEPPGISVAVEVNSADDPIGVNEQPGMKIKSEKTKLTSSAGKRGRRSLKEVGITSDLMLIPEDEILFQKQYYSIGEVAIMFRENQSLIRYWETEFDILQPRKNRKGDRFFRPIDIKNLVLIYDLLRRRKFTIEGAKDYLKKNKKAEEKFAMIQSLQKIKGFLLELKANL